MNAPKRYHSILVTLHWLTVIFMFGAGFLAEDERRSPIDIHMILGAILLVLMLARLVARFSTPRPAPLDAGNFFFNMLSGLTHLGLYLTSFLILALGGLVAYKRNLFAYLLDHSVNLERVRFIGAIHHLWWILLLGLIFLHLVGALYHQFVLKDNVLARMWYGR